MLGKAVAAAGEVMRGSIRLLQLALLSSVLGWSWLHGRGRGTRR
jgi:hypothetical protein